MKIKTILNDTLKNSQGKYSRKNLTMLVSFIVAILIGFIIVYGELKGKSFNKTYLVFECFMIMSGYNGILTVADKKIKDKEVEHTEQG